MQILERIRRKRKFNEDVEELEDSFKASYGDADEETKKQRVRLNRETLSYILERTSPYIFKQPTFTVPQPIETYRQFGITLEMNCFFLDFTTFRNFNRYLY